MLTLAVENPPVTRRRSFADFVIRLVATAVLLGSVIGLAVVVVFAFGIHRFFDEWQAGVVALLIAAPLVGLVIAAWYVLRRRHIARGPTGYVRLLAVAVLPGIFVGGWITTFVADTMSDTVVHFSPEGNPRGPAVSSLKNAVPAPASLATRMLAPANLGVGWYAQAEPNPALMPMTSQELGQGQLVRVKDFIDSDHWTGSLWRKDGTTIEVLLHFDSAAHASTYTASWMTQSPGVALSSETVGQTVIQKGVIAGDGWFASFRVGDNYFELQEDNIDSMPTAAQFQTVVAAAVAKATETP